MPPPLLPQFQRYVRRRLKGRPLYILYRAFNGEEDEFKMAKVYDTHLHVYAITSTGESHHLTKLEKENLQMGALLDVWHWSDDKKNKDSIPRKFRWIRAMLWTKREGSTHDCSGLIFDPQLKKLVRCPHADHIYLSRDEVAPAGKALVKRPVKKPVKKPVTMKPASTTVSVRTSTHQTQEPDGTHLPTLRTLLHALYTQLAQKTQEDANVTPF